MSKSMIYVVHAASEMSVEQTLSLRNAIFELANKRDEEIFFHRPANDNTLGGAPALMIECSGNFMDKVKALALYGSSHDILPGTSTFRTGHGGPATANTWKRVLANDPAETMRLHDDILALAQQKGVAGDVLIRHIDTDKGFMSLFCPDDFVADIKKLPRVSLIVTPEEAGRFRHKAGPKR